MYFNLIKYLFYSLFIGIVIVVFILFLPGPLVKDKLIKINKGSGAYALSKSLLKKNIVRNDFVLRVLLKTLKKDKKLPVGEFLMRKHQSLISVIATITSNEKRYFRRFTIPEGYTVGRVKKILIELSFLKGDFPEKVKEGSLMPDTYFFSRGESRANIINRMQSKMKIYLNKVWDNRARSLPISNKEKLLTMASMIESETNDKKERFIIASVFVNRLRKHMRLQSDPTVAYGLKKQPRRLTSKDLRIKTPFNTYTIKGLPIHPINNPGRSSIYAAAHPAKSDYLYFVSNGKGGHFFSKTLKEQDYNIKKWLKVLAKNS